MRTVVAHLLAQQARTDQNPLHVLFLQISLVYGIVNFLDIAIFFIEARRMPASLRDEVGARDIKRNKRRMEIRYQFLANAPTLFSGANAHFAEIKSISSYKGLSGSQNESYGLAIFFCQETKKPFAIH